jgi:hypothetical protein
MKIFLNFIQQTYTGLLTYFIKKENRLSLGFIFFFITGMAIYTVIRASNPSNPTDFGNHFYNAARDIFYRGESIFGKYNYNSYPPFFYCIITFFAVFTKPVAALLWYLFSVILYLLSISMVRDLLQKELKIKKVSILLPLLMLVFLIADNLYLGQSNFIPIFFIIMAFYFDSEEMDKHAGIALGIAIALKITPGLLVLYFLLNKKWMTVLFSGISFLTAILIIPGFFFGFQENFTLSAEWFKRVIIPFISGGKMKTDTVSYYHLNQSLEAVANRYLTPYGKEGYGGVFNRFSIALTPEQLGFYLKIAKALILAGLAWLQVLYKKNKMLVASFYLFAILLISPASWINHYLLLTLPYFTLVNYARYHWKNSFRTFTIILISAGYALTLFSVNSKLQAMGFLFFGNFLLFTLLYIGLAVIALKKNIARAELDR